MDDFKLPRNPDKMRDSITITDKMVANRDLWIIVPSRYKNIGMLKFSKKIQIVGLFYLTDGSYHSVSRIAGTFELSPSTISEYTYKDKQYSKLFFPKGSVMADSKRLLMLRVSMFGMLQEFILRGNIPPFVTTMDLLLTMNNGGKYVDKKFGNGGKVLESVLAAVSRSATNPTIYSRSLNGDVPTVFKGLMDMGYGYNNTPAKITHNFFKKGLKSVLANDNKTNTRQDKILRGQNE